MIKGKLSQIKNKDGEVTFPVTSSQAVYMKDGVTTVEEKMGEVSKELIDARYSPNDTQHPTLGHRLNHMTDKLSILKSEKINVRDFGAKGDGVTDDTKAIQDAINHIKNLGGTLFLPKGDYVISNNLSYRGLTKSISILGDGLESTLIWKGGDNGVINDFSGVSNGELKCTFAKLKAVKSDNACENLIFFKSDSSPQTYLINLTFDNNHFRGIDTILDIYRETDQVIFNDNYVLGYTNAIVTYNGVCSNIHVLHNHFRGGSPGGTALLHQGGSNISFIGNTVQSGNNGIIGVHLKNVTNFTIENTYFETPHTKFDAYAFIIENSSTGVIQGTHSHGAVKDIITINGSRNITIGNNKHSVSGGYPRKFLVVNESINIRVTGVLEGWSTRTIALLEGKVDFMIDKVHNGTYFDRQFTPISSDLNYTNIEAFQSATIFRENTLGRTYIFSITNQTEGFDSTGFIVNSKVPKIIEFGNTSNGKLKVELDEEGFVKVTNTMSTTRTIHWSFLRFK